MEGVEQLPWPPQATLQACPHLPSTSGAPFLIVLLPLSRTHQAKILCLLEESKGAVRPSQATHPTLITAFRTCGPTVSASFSAPFSLVTFVAWSRQPVLAAY